MSAHAQSRATARRRPARRRARTQRRRLGLLALVIGLAVVALLSLKPWADKAVQELKLPLRHEDVIRQQAA